MVDSYTDNRRLFLVRSNTPESRCRFRLPSNVMHGDTTHGFCYVSLRRSYVFGLLGF